MYNKVQKGQGVIWIILLVAAVILLIIWITKNPSFTLNTGQNTSTISATPTTAVSAAPTPTESLQDIEKSLKDLSTDAANIDKGINDSPLDINQ